jgi:hypothetical protein
MDQLTTAQKPSGVENAAVHSRDSSLREKVLEHLFVGDLLRCLWRKGVCDIEVLRAEVDRGGYDLVLESNGVMRHVQLKSSYRLSTTSEVDVSLNLWAKPCGCVIWIWFDANTMDLGPFLWLGAGPGARLPHPGDKVSRHSKGDHLGYKSRRPNHRVVGKGRFKILPKMEDVILELFGERLPAQE